LRVDQDVLAKAIPLLTKGEIAESPLASTRVVAKALLANPSAADLKALRELIDDGAPAGDDMIVLTAFAARRAGGESWQSFRAASRDLLGESPLSGHVVVLIGRLGQPRLELASRAK
jgi:hypothetical protein